MGYCLSSSVAPRYLEEAAEIKIQYKDKEKMKKLSEKYPEATLAKLKTDCNYNLEIASGTLMVREFEGKNGTQQVLVIYVTDCTINDEKKTNHKKSKDSLI